MKKSQPQYLQASPSHGNTSTGQAAPTQAGSTCPATLLATAPSKMARVLAYLRHTGSLNRFEAARLVGDTCLNSTISALANNHGVTFERIPEKSPNNWGKPCDCIRYRIPESAQAQADRVLALLFKHKQAA